MPSDAVPHQVRGRRVGGARPAGRAPRGAVWAVGRLPPQLLALLVVVEAPAVGLVAWAWVTDPPRLPALGTATLLAALAVGYNEFVLRKGPGALSGTGPSNTDLMSVWLFGGALVLPSGLGGLLAMVVPIAVWQRSRHADVPLHRSVYSAATVALAVIVAGRLAAAVGGAHPATHLTAVVLAGCVFALVNNLLVALAAHLSEPDATRATLFGRAGDNAVELATITLGGLAAAAIGINVWLVLLVLPAVVVLERAVALPQLEEDANVDRKTGLLNMAAWHRAAAKDLRRASRAGTTRGVLVVDLDHFKTVNDTYGHLAGDVVLSAVADTVCGSVRRRDLVGRFGGEEFVVLITPLPGGGVADIEAVAERLRARVADLRVPVTTPRRGVTIDGLHVSVGVALLRPVADPAGRGELRDLLGLADAALYAAKRAGRNCVRIGEWAPAPARSPRTDG